MVATPTPQIINARYILREQLGAGGMGEVYRAYDRLNRLDVALKRVTRAGQRMNLVWEPTATQTDSTSLQTRLALANEFQLMASLRHPNIITVLDYGFDNQQQPFFTMRLLENPRTIVQAAANHTPEARIRLLIQLFQALVYLHRWNIVHRDLKPANVLVLPDDNLKVLDFGLSVRHNQQPENLEDSIAGTLAYIAPELLLAAPATPTSDLYSAGVIAYEILVGHHPFDIHNPQALISDIMTTDPDLSELDTVLQIANNATQPTIRLPNMNITAVLAPIIERLLRKDPQERYQNARDVIADLQRALQAPVQIESHAIRESFLQAAQFVGRQTELNQLLTALNKLLDASAKPTSDAWLISGESGVGKSRLINELTTQALVKGVLVLQGRTAAEDETPYMLWRGILRQLVLHVEPSATATSLLQIIIPDLAELLGKPLALAPDHDPARVQRRLPTTVSYLFSQVKQPVLVVLEDLHWATSGDLDLLLHLLRQLERLNLLIVATYRSDETPELLYRLPAMHHMHLSRLDSAEIRQLTQAMLGEHTGSEVVQRFIERETEDNVYFITEILRALAEEVGQLEHIGLEALPQTIVTGGVQRVVQRRLERVPANAMPLLQIAAIGGRYLELDVLQLVLRDPDFLTLVHTMVDNNTITIPSLDDWLLLCADAAVIDVAQEQWRFTHDKLREGLLAHIRPERIQSANRIYAQALERVHPDAVTRLAHHWQAANNPERELQYVLPAGQKALDSGLFIDARRLLSRSIALLEGMIILRDDDRLLTAKRSLARTLWHQGEHAAADVLYEEILPVARRRRGSTVLAHVLRDYGSAAMNRGDFDQGILILEESLALFQRLGDRQGEGRLVGHMALVSQILGQPQKATAYYEQAARIAAEVDDRYAAGRAKSGLAALELTAGRFDASIANSHAARAIAEEIGDRDGISVALGNLGFALIEQGQAPEAADAFRQAIAIKSRMPSSQKPSTWLVWAVRYVQMVTYMVHCKRLKAHSKPSVKPKTSAG